MKKLIVLSALFLSLFVGVSVVFAIPPKVNNRCENGEFITMNGSNEKYTIELPEGIQVCSVFVTMDDTFYRFTGDFESPQMGFFVTGLGMNKVYYNNTVSLWYEQNKPDNVEVYYRNDLSGEHTPTVTINPVPTVTPTAIVGPAPNPSNPNRDDPLYLPVIIK